MRDATVATAAESKLPLSHSLTFPPAHFLTLPLSGVALTLLLVLPATAADKITYEDHVLPILRNNCLKCHNPDKLKGDLDMTTFNGLLKGGGSGPGVVSGDPDGSKIVKAITHAEEPNMPPNAPKLTGKDIDIIKRWISGGLLESSGSKALPASKPKVDLAVSNMSVGKPDGPPPMPGELLLEPAVHTERTGVATGLATSPWAPLIAIGGQKQILLYNSDSLELLGILPYAEGFPSDVKFSRNGKLLIVGGGHPSKSGQAIIWDITTGQRVTTIGDEFDSVLAADISADQKLVAIGGPNRLVKIFATQDGSLVNKMKKHTDWVTTVEFSPDGKLLATGDRNGGLVVWEAVTGEELCTLVGHKAAITSVSWRGDSDVVASSSEDGTIKLWKMTDGDLIKSFNAHNGGVLAAQFTHDARLVSCGRDNQIATWDGTGKKLRTINSTNDLPVRATFTHDGNHVVSADWSGKILVWNAADGKPQGTLAVNPAPLAERIRDAESNLQKLAAEGAKSESKLAQLKSSIARMKTAQSFTAVYRAKERLLSQTQERERIKAALADATSAASKAQEELTTAQKLTAKTKPDSIKKDAAIKTVSANLKSSRARITSLKNAIEKLTHEIASDKTLADKLSAEYEARKKSAASTNAKSQSKAGEL